MKKNTILSIGSNYGLLAGLATSTISLVTYFIGQEKISTVWVSLLSLALLLTFMLLSISTFKKGNSGYASFSQAFKVSLTTAVIAAVISGGYMAIHTSVVAPDFQEVALASAEESILKSNPDASQEEIDLGILMVKKFTTTTAFVIGGFFSVVFPGLFFALLLAAFLKKDPPFDADIEIIDQKNN